jgi:GDP-L-fucose synthase
MKDIKMQHELPKDSRIYVAGHRGLVGSAILRTLEKNGHTNLLTATREQLDLRDQAAVNYWFKANRPEYVFLVAGTVGGIWANATRPAEFIYDNMMIHATVVHAAHLYKVKKLLYLGSSCIYPRECPQPMREEYLLGNYLEPTNEPYAIAKIAGIKLCQAYRKQYNCNFISAMPTNLYGPNDNFDLESSHVLPALIRKFHLAKLATQGDWEALRKDETIFGPLPEDLRQSYNIPSSPNEPGNPKNLTNQIDQIDPINQMNQKDGPKVTIWGTGSARREFLHVDDLANACTFIMENWEDANHINVGIGEDQTIKELAELVRDIVYPGAEIVFDSAKPDGTPQKLLDISKLKELGWTPKLTFEEGIRSTYAWYLSQAT